MQQVSTFMQDADEGSSGERGFGEHSPTSASGIRARGKATAHDSDDDDDESDDDDDSEQIMTPRGVYVHRCLCAHPPLCLRPPRCVRCTRSRRGARAGP